VVQLPSLPVAHATGKDMSASGLKTLLLFQQPLVA